jgi:hydroxypyruvate reductase
MIKITEFSTAARAIFARSLAACNVESAFTNQLQPTGTRFALSLPAALAPQCTPADSLFDLTGVAQVLVIAAGKAAPAMLQGLLRTLRLPPACRLSGALIAPERPQNLPPGLAHFAGGHPLPNEQSFAGAHAALSLLQRAASAPERAFSFFLLSGGASAMLELPLAPAITLSDTIAFHRALVHSGASITEINCVRKHFSAVKGGRLGQVAASIPNLTLLVSDVPSGQLDSLASGPTLPDRSTVAECHAILRRYSLLPQFPAAVRQFFSASLPETPKPGAFPARFHTLLCSDDLAEAARREASALDFTAVIDNTCDDWDFAEAANYLLRRLRSLRREHPRVCLISTGEVTVKVPSSSGTGGRNQHFALYAATQLKPADGNTVILSAGSDGLDGNSPFAGAVLDCDSLQAAEHAGHSAQSALRRFDASPFLRRINATIQSGPTGNNLRDLRLLLCE